MTVTMIIAIIAAVVFVAFCILCIVVLFSNQRETKDFRRRITTIEKDIDAINGLLSDEAAAEPQEPIALDEFFGSITLDDLEDDFSDVLPEEQDDIPQDSPEDVNPYRPAAAVQKEPDNAAPAGPDIPVSDAPGVIAPIEIEDDLDILNQVLGVYGNSGTDINHLISPVDEEQETTVEEEPEITPTQRQHYDYDVGRSGRKYTISELEMLIRE